MLIRVEKDFFNNNNIPILNSKIAVTISILNSNEQIKIV